MKIILPAVFLLLLCGCDGGLAPTVPAGPAIAGTVSFVPGTWPAADSVVNLWLFVSKIYPLDSSKVFTGILTGSILVLPAPDTSSITDIHVPVSSVRYFYKVPAGRYPYVGVVQRLRSDFSIRSFRVVGVYSEPESPPAPRLLVVPENEVVEGVDISVDFFNVPPQPF